MMICFHFLLLQKLLVFYKKSGLKVLVSFHGGAREMRCDLGNWRGFARMRTGRPPKLPPPVRLTILSLIRSLPLHKPASAPLLRLFSKEIFSVRRKSRSANVSLGTLLTGISPPNLHLFHRNVKGKSPIKCDFLLKLPQSA